MIATELLVSTTGPCLPKRSEATELYGRAQVRYLRFKADDGEGYGNLAVAFTMLKKKEEAYTVLGQGVSHAWSNWKLWQNYLSGPSGVFKRPQRFPM